MDIKQTIEDITKKVTSDKNIAEKFQKNPIKTIEELVGIDLPDDQINQIITAVKAKLNLDKESDLLGGLFGKTK